MLLNTYFPTMSFSGPPLSHYVISTIKFLSVSLIPLYAISTNYISCWIHTYNFLCRDSKWHQKVPSVLKLKKTPICSTAHKTLMWIFSHNCLVSIFCLAFCIWGSSSSIMASMLAHRPGSRDYNLALGRHSYL